MSLKSYKICGLFPKNPKVKAYIGISGITGKVIKEFVCDAKKLCIDKKSNPRFPAMAGLLISYKELDRNTSHGPGSKYVNISDARDTLKEFGKDIFTSIHYCTVGDRAGLLASEVDKVLSGLKVLPDAIQINLHEPHLQEMGKIREKYNEIKIILQLKMSKLTMEESLIINYVGKYHNIIDAILLDRGEGEGTPWEDIAKAAPLINLLRRKFEGLSIGIAGGFLPGNIADKIQNLAGNLAPHLPFNIDAESGLRIKNRDQDNYIRDRGLEYMGNALSAFKEAFKVKSK